MKFFIKILTIAVVASLVVWFLLPKEEVNLNISSSSFFDESHPDSVINNALSKPDDVYAQKSQANGNPAVQSPKVMAVVDTAQIQEVARVQTKEPALMAKDEESMSNHYFSKSFASMRQESVDNPNSPENLATIKHLAAMRKARLNPLGE